MNANSDLKENPMDNLILNQMEELDLELELFGTPTNDIVEISSIQVYEFEEDITLGYDSAIYLPKDFDARKGMEGIDWNTIELYEVEEEVNLDFDAKAHLPKDFNPYQGMITVKSQGICLF